MDGKEMDRGAQSASDHTQYEPLHTPANGNGRALHKTESGDNALSLSPSMRRVRSNNGHGVADETDGSSGPDETNAERKDPFEVVWDGDDDPMCPRSMSLLHKWALVVIVGMGSLCVTAASSIYSTTYGQMNPEFHMSTLVGTTGLSTFVLGIALGPLLMSPLSEFFGRRPIYLASWTMFLIWLIPSAVAPNAQTIIVVSYHHQPLFGRFTGSSPSLPLFRRMVLMVCGGLFQTRFFDGFAGSSFLSVAGGTVSDVFTRDAIQGPMTIIALSPFIGPSLGPLIGGFINYNTGWRWTYYVMIMWAFGLWVSILLLAPETYHPIKLREKARARRRETGDKRWKAPMEKTDKSMARAVGVSLLRPFQLLLWEPMCLLLCLFSAILLGILYLFFGAFHQIFGEVYGFNLWQTGVAFLGILVGMVTASATDPLWSRTNARLLRANGGRPEPEFRLPPAVVGAVLVPLGLFMFAWTTYPAVHWIVPIIGSGLFGMGTLLVFTGIFTFLVDAYPHYAASAMAANAFVRCTLAAAFPLFGLQMYQSLGYQWGSSVLAFLTVAMLPFPYLFFRYGKTLRQHSKFASSQ